MLGWCGVDGALLKPVVPFASESFKDISADLEPMLLELRDARLQAGQLLYESAPAFHATDVFGRHRLQLEKLYGSAWRGLEIVVSTQTPKGGATGAVVPASACCPTTVVGEPVHDVITVRRLASPACNDCTDFLLDHQDMITRLSAPHCTSSVEDEPSVHALPRASATLLQHAALLSTSEFNAKWERAPAHTQQTLKTFLQRRTVLASSLWKRLFRAIPPRGTLARIARRVCAKLHPSNGLCNYAALKDFRTEGRRIRRWYRHGRKSTRRRYGIRRTTKPSPRIRGLRSVWNNKLRRHYKILFGLNKSGDASLRLQGLWRWRTVALGLHRAGIPVQSGTIPVERLWASLSSMFPDGSRCITLEWFTLLSNLAFLRFNYRHFHTGLLASWTEGDSLMSERLENLAAAARAVQDDDGSLSELFDPFR